MQHIDTTIGRVAASARGRGAVSLVIVGSWSRGTPGPLSDLDVICLGDGPEYELEAVGQTLVAWAWRSFDDQRTRFESPEVGALEAAAWREARILFDHDDQAFRLQQLAATWTWDRIGDGADRWVAEEFSGLAEEMHKILAASAAGRQRLALIQIRYVAIRLHWLAAVHLRHEALSENDLWDVVERLPEVDGPLRRALIVDVQSRGPDLGGSAVQAIMEAYEALAQHLWSVMSPRQAAVVRLVLERNDLR